MGKYVAVGVLAMIVLAAITYEPPEKTLRQEAKTESFQATFGASQAAPLPADPAPPALPSGAAAAPVPTVPATPTPAAPVATEAAPDQGTYVVKRGQTLRDVAQEIFGDRERWKEIYEQNKEHLPDANTLREGMSLAYRMVGAAAQAARGGAQPASTPAPAAPAPVPTVPATPTPAAPTAVATGRTYTVGKGDTLYGIARKELGSGARWQEIVALNSLPSEHVRAGTVLRLP